MRRCPSIGTIATLLIGACTASGCWASTLQSCGPAVQKLFQSYQEDAQKDRPRIAKYFGDRVVRGQLDSLMDNWAAGLEESVQLRDLDTTARVWLLVVRGRQVSDEKVACTDKQCAVEFSVAEKDGAKTKYAFHYAYDAKDSESCESLKVTGIELFANPIVPSDAGKVTSRR